MAVNPANPQTWNMYAYVGDNPTTLNDPSGLWWVDAGNCSYDQEAYGSVTSGVVGGEQDTAIQTRIVATVCSGIADGDAGTGPIPDTSYQYRNRNAMIVAAEQKRAPVPSGNIWDYGSCAAGAGINQFFGSEGKAVQTAGYWVGTSVLAATGNPLVFPAGALAAIYYTNGFLKVRAKCEKETGYIP